MNTKVSNSDIKTKTLKESKEEIDKILEKLESLNLKDLESSIKDYEKLLKLNKHIDNLYKQKLKKITKTIKLANDKKIKKKR
tara:strand:- start:1459 stop:1704 length:246 start_codon:yes stop_codon:yes gene_type:complete